MGNEIGECCIQTLTTEEDDDGEHSDSNIALSNTAKALHQIKESKSHKDINDDNNAALEEITDSVPKRLHHRECNKKSKKSKRSKRSSMKRYKEKRSMSVEEELDAIEIEVKQQKLAIKLLKKQNEYLRKQNEQFLLKYGSYFASSPKLTTETSVHSDTTNIDNLSQISQISYSNGYDISNNIPISPLSPLILTNKQTSIILTYSNTSNNGTSFATNNNNVDTTDTTNNN